MSKWTDADAYEVTLRVADIGVDFLDAPYCNACGRVYDPFSVTGQRSWIAVCDCDEWDHAVKTFRNPLRQVFLWNKIRSYRKGAAG